MIWPLTPRGLFVTAVAYVCIFTLGIAESDLLAPIVGAILIICLLTFLTLIIPSYIIIKRALIIEHLGELGKSHSNETCDYSISLSNFNIPPLFNLDIERVFQLSENQDLKTNKISSKVFQCRGSFKNPHNIVSPLIFPHRGIFEQDHFKARLSDYFGLTKISWKINSKISFPIYAQDRNIEPIPIMLASSISGDLTNATDVRSGDLFDTKQYQPGDSLKRVLWKVYARSEELIVRYPEPAIIPEGELLSYSIALAQHDDVISAALNYLKMVDEQNINFLAGFAGAKGLVASNINIAEENSIKYPADLTPENALKEFELFMDTLKSNNHHPSEIILFLPKLTNQFENETSGATKSIIDMICYQAKSMQLKVHLAEVECTPIKEEATLVAQKELLKKVIPLRKKNTDSPSDYQHQSDSEVYKVHFI